MRRTLVHRIDLAISLISIAFFVWLSALNPAIIEERIETLTLIYRFQIRNLIQKPPVPNNIVTVLVDEKSLSEFGRWPWPRTLQAELMTKILDQDPKVLAIDIMYPEKWAGDENIARALAPHKEKVVLATAFSVPEIQTDVKEGPEAPDYLTDAAILSIKDMKLGKAIQADGIIPPVPEIGKNAQLGHAYNRRDIDGKTIWDISYLKYRDDFYPSLALQTARIALDIPTEEVVLYMGRGIAIGSRIIPFNPFGGKVLINYLGRELTIPHVSAADVLKGTLDKAFFRDKIILLGTSAISTHDIIVTPFSADMPGVEKNATLTENIINSRFIIKAYQSVEIGIIILTGLLFGFVYSRLRALQASLCSLATVIGYLVIVQILFTYYGIWMNVFYPVTNMLVIFGGATITKYFLEERKAKEIRRIFSSYVSPKIVEEVINDPEKAGLSGRKKTVTILFSDIIGFTSISERHTPEQVVALLNEYFNVMTDIIFKWDGTLDKFVGDEIMAFWGAPIDQPDHAERAVQCALEMVERLALLQKKWASEAKEILKAGIGINTGEVIIGNIGAEGKKMDYTAIGDPVNTAARVEKLTRTYHAKILITEETAVHIRPLIGQGTFGHAVLRFADTVKVKGKENDLKIFEIKDSREEETS